MMGKGLIYCHRVHLLKILGGKRLWEFASAPGKFHSADYGTPLGNAQSFLSRFSPEEAELIGQGIMPLPKDAPAPAEEESTFRHLLRLLKNVPKHERDDILFGLLKEPNHALHPEAGSSD